jgi:hypothetical protein
MKLVVIETDCSMEIPGLWRADKFFPRAVLKQARRKQAQEEKVHHKSDPDSGSCVLAEGFDWAKNVLESG